MERFSERLKELRKTKGFKQTDMAAFLEITSRHYQAVEYGKINIPALTLVALARFFDVSVDYLVGESDNPARR